MQKQKKGRFKAGKTKGIINDFKLSGDEEENVKPKKVSFMKTKRTSSPVNSEQLNFMKSGDDRHSSVRSQSNSSSLHSDSPFSSLSEKFLPESALLQNHEWSKSVTQSRNQTESVVKKSLSDSPLPLNSENSQRESCPEPLPSEQDEDNQRIGEPRVPQPRERSVKPKLSTGCPAQDMSPRPKPRQRTVNMCDFGQLEEEPPAETPAYSRTDTSSMSIALSSEKSQTSASDSVLHPDEDQAMSEKSEFCSPAEQMSEAPVTVDSAASEESKERNYSTSFEEKHQIFEKWKEEHDSILKDRIREKKQSERRQKLQQAKEKHERTKDSISAFAGWSDRKKDVIGEKVRAEHRKEKIKEVEEEYEKEEKEKMALEMYDKWLKRKEFQQERERKEKKIQAILQEEPPPPWSPPNKTIPFGK
ncbi:hypothetical protein cypCar_00006629 [Cyprinus carpio]|nr:hypothetical protein cypCar_00006629 [Cyprinus carpio]